MQFAMCNVRLGDVNSDSGMIIRKGPVSPAEVVVLQRIHGHDSVSDIKLIPKALDKTPHADELNKLREYYTMRDGDNGPPIVDACFPGAFPRLPITFREIGIDLGEEVEEVTDQPADTNGDGSMSSDELKAALKQMGVTVKGNPKLATLQKMYDDAQATQAAGESDDDGEEPEE